MVTIKYFSRFQYRRLTALTDKQQRGIAYLKEVLNPVFVTYSLTKSPTLSTIFHTTTFLDITLVEQIKLRLKKIVSGHGQTHHLTMIPLSLAIFHV